MDLATIQPQSYISTLKDFLIKYHCVNIENILLEEDEYRHISIYVCTLTLIDFNSAVSSLLLSHPVVFLSYFDEALLHAQDQFLVKLQKNPSKNTAKMKIKRLCHIRLLNLPPVEPVTKLNISGLRSSDVNKMIQIAGTVVRTGMIKMLESSREYQCKNAKCEFQFVVKADIEQGNVLELPKTCPSTGSKCNSSQFELVKGSTLCCDYQEIQIQEQVHKLSMGSIPRSIVVILENDLVDSIKAGDDVTLVGILMRRWVNTIKGTRCELDIIVRANSLTILNNTNFDVTITDEIREEFDEFWQEMKETPFAARNQILANICPQVKLAVALTLIGGCTTVDKNGMRTRGEPHMLLVGDPGTGKSQFLRFTAMLSPRSVLTTGIGTTSAGLTCTAVKDGNEWILEAGALVLADRGVCCIDEFSSIRAHDRSSIHEAMEQQTVSVAKAGLVCKLNTRTTIFAVTNPKGKFDLETDVSVNTAIASPLLSRFDIVLLLLDTPNDEWDNAVSSFILDQSSESKTSNMKPLHNEKDKKWNFRKLQAYLYWVKGKYNPTLSSDAILVLQKYYQIQRSADSRKGARTTIRLLESITRLSQAHARLMCRSEATVQDAVVSVLIMEASIHTTAILGVDSVLHSVFPDRPDEEYILQEENVLRELNLSHLSTCPSRPETNSSFRGNTPSPSPSDDTTLLPPKSPSRDDTVHSNNNQMRSPTTTTPTTTTPTPKTYLLSTSSSSSSKEKKKTSDWMDEIPNSRKRKKYDLLFSTEE